MLGEKTKFQFTATTLQDVPNLVSIDMNEVSYESVETHVMGGTVMTTRPSSMADVGEITIEVIWTPDNAVHEAIAASVGSATETAAAVVYENGDKDTFNVWTISSKWTNTSRDAAQLHRQFKFKVNSIPVHVEAA